MARNPLRAFDWLNHLLACSLCNSNLKRDRFPLDGAGLPLLIDPTSEDPFDHLRLSLAEGGFHALTAKGEHSIEVFGLNRPALKMARAYARILMEAALPQILASADRGDKSSVRQLADAILNQPSCVVLAAMLREAEKPGAAVVFSADVLRALRHLDDRFDRTNSP